MIHKKVMLKRLRDQLCLSFIKAKIGFSLQPEVIMGAKPKSGILRATLIRY